MVLLPQLGIKLQGSTPTTIYFNPGTSMPTPTPQPTKIKQLLPLLQQKPNRFQLHQSLSSNPNIHIQGEYSKSQAYGVVDLDNGKVLISQRFSTRLPIASIAKLMSAIVALDLASPDELFTVSEKAASMIPSKIGLKVGERLSVRELLAAMLLFSANDATAVIQENIDQKYGERLFVEAMNQKAQFLGLKNTHFANPQGFDDPEQYSSVEDVIIFTKYALDNYPLIKELVATDFLVLNKNIHHSLYRLPNWNGLLGVYPGVNGGKIGQTDAAGKTTVVTAQRGDKNLIVVVLGAPGSYERDLWAAQLLDLGFQSTLNLPPIGVTRSILKEKYLSWSNLLR